MGIAGCCARAASGHAVPFNQRAKMLAMFVLPTISFCCYMVS